MPRRKNKQKQKENSEPPGNSENGSTTTPPVPRKSPSPTRNEAQQTAPHKPQYHHYIPRFIIRNFALEDHLKHTKERHDVYYYSLEDGRLQISDVDTSYGVFDMYADIQNLANLHWVELKLSELERTASTILQRVIDSQNTKVTMTFPELIDLKRFLWTMSFRYPDRRRQYTEGRFSDAGKKVEMDFMKAKGRGSLDDVWLENMRGFLSETLDDAIGFSLFDLFGKGAGGKVGLIEQNTYRIWSMTSFLCIWEAEEPYEFIFTDNGFNIFEGDCGRGFPSQAYHYFYPVSPRRIIVASKVWFKPVLNPFEKHSLHMAKAMFGLDPANSVLAKVEHIPPEARYHGKLAEFGLFHSERGGTKGDEESLRDSRKLTTYTYTIVKVMKPEVDRINACLLNEVSTALSFRTPARMICTIRQWRKHGRSVNWGRDVFPPHILAGMPAAFGLRFPDFEKEILGDLDPKTLSRDPAYLDALEKELKVELNRTHEGRPMQTGEIGEKTDGCWDVKIADQPTRSAWRRSGRQRRSPGEQGQ